MHHRLNFYSLLFSLPRIFSNLSHVFHVTHVLPLVFFKRSSFRSCWRFFFSSNASCFFSSKSLRRCSCLRLDFNLSFIRSFDSDGTSTIRSSLLPFLSSPCNNCFFIFLKRSFSKRFTSDDDEGLCLPLLLLRDVPPH